MTSLLDLSTERRGEIFGELVERLRRFGWNFMPKRRADRVWQAAARGPAKPRRRETETFNFWVSLTAARDPERKIRVLRQTMRKRWAEQTQGSQSELSDACTRVPAMGQYVRS